MAKKEVYDNIKRAKAGLKRFWKVVIPWIPQIVEVISKQDVPYKSEITAVLIAAVALEKALQKDKNK